MSLKFRRRGSEEVERDGARLVQLATASVASTLHSLLVVIVMVVILLLGRGTPTSFGWWLGEVGAPRPRPALLLFPAPLTRPQRILSPLQRVSKWLIQL